MEREKEVMFAIHQKQLEELKKIREILQNLLAYFEEEEFEDIFPSKDLPEIGV